jgi:predicted RND superfamily exporter protein
VGGATSPYLDAAGGASRLIVISPRVAAEDSAACTALVNRVEAALVEHKGRIGAAAVEHALTGLPAMNGQSARLLEREMLRITAAASVGLLLLLWLSLRDVRATLVCFLPLMVSLAVMLLLARVFFNPIYFLTVGFAAIVLGIGLDVGLHLTARLGSFTASGEPMARAVEHTMLDCGPPVVIGMVSTAAAFLALTFTGNPGLIQFSLLSAIALLATLVVTLVLFPALATVAWKRPDRVVLAGVRWVPRSVFRLPGRHPVAAVGLALVLAGGALPLATGFRLDMDLMRLFPADIEAISEGRAVAREFGTSFASTLQAVVHAPSWESAMAAQELVDAELARRVEGGEVAAFDSPSSMLVYPGRLGADDLSDAAALLIRQRPRFDALLDELGFTREPGFEAHYQVLETMAALELGPAPAGDRHSRLSGAVVHRSPSGWLLRTRVWPAAGASDGELLTSPGAEDLARCLEELGQTAGVEVRLTGPAAVLERTNQVVRSDFRRVSWIGATLVVVVLALFLRSARLTAVALAPLVAALITVLAIAVLVQIPFTPSAVSFVAIIVGVGIDDAVHILSRLGRTGQPDVAAVLQDIGPVITLTTLSSALGFGCLALSSHAVVSSIGAIVAVGVLACWLFTVLLLPGLARGSWVAVR